MRSNLNLSVDAEVADAIRAEAKRQRRPTSWVVEDAIKRVLVIAGEASPADPVTPAPAVRS